MKSIASPDSGLSPLDYSPSDFMELLHESVLVGQRCRTLQDAVDAVVSLVGRVVLEDARNAFTSSEKSLLAQFGNDSVYPVIDGLLKLEPDSVYLGVSSYGRVRFFRGRSRPDDVTVFCKTSIPGDALARSSPAQGRPAELLQEFYRAHSATPTSELIAKVVYAFDHIDPVILYVDDQTYTNHETYNNLLSKGAKKTPGYLLDDLPARPLDTWSESEKVLIACVYLLATSATRIEEFSGQQVTLPIVEEFLREKYRRLCVCAGSDPEPCELTSLPARIVELRRSIRKDFFAYRTINGLTLNKHEHYERRNRIDLSLSALPTSVVRYIGDRYGVHSDRERTLDDYFDRVIDLLEPDDQVDPRKLSPLEQLLEQIVLAATYESSSDIGMTRGVRDLPEWSRLFRDERYVEICDLPLASYFCAVFSSERCRETLVKAGIYQKVLSAISGRMTFNSWHYTPGHCPIETVPKDRHFYTPPAMSDTTDWSDKHHQGHVFAQVRYSIRSPGGLFINGTKQRGLFDLRLMRMSGEPYRFSDLLRARAYTSYLRAVYQSTLNAALNGKKVGVVRAFTKPWYKTV